MKTIFCLSIAYQFLLFSCHEPKSLDREIRFSSNWKFNPTDVKGAENPDFDDSSWRTLDLSHDSSIDDISEKESINQIGPFSKESAGGKSNVAVMAESAQLEDIESGRKSSQSRYFKAKVLSSDNASETSETIKESCDEKSIVFTDDSTSYVHISDYVELHVTEKSSEKLTKKTLRWVHIAISNAKRNLLGKYHKIKGKYFQLYLNEFV